MREDPRWARTALLANLVGTILLALSFQATSSDFRLVTTSDMFVPSNAGHPPSHFNKVFALCTKDRTLVAEGTDASGPALILSAPGCPDSAHAKSAAVVNLEIPSLLYIGLGCSAFGFFVQFMIVPRRKTVAEINDEMRVLRKQKKLLELQDERKL